MKTRNLGNTDIKITPIGLGCWQFSNGKGMIGGFWPKLDQNETNKIVKTTLDGGVNWFDTAEIYGGGESEKALAAALHELGQKPGKPVVATKWWPAFRFAGNIETTIDERLRCLDGFPIDLYQVHQPFSFSSATAEMQAMAKLIRAGKIKSVGVSNFSADKMREAHRALQSEGLTLASNQVKYSLVDRSIESNGILETAKELGITIIAYSPLGQGILSGKFHDDPSLIKKRVGPRRFMPQFGKSGLEKTRPLVEELKKLATEYNATPSQVALNWLIHFHGDTVVAIPGATKESHARDNAASMKFQLNKAEMEKLHELAKGFL